MKQLLFAGIAPLMWAISGAALGKSKSPISYPIAIGIATILLLTYAFITDKAIVSKSDIKPLLIAGIAYGIAGYVFNGLVSGRSDANYWVAITAAMLPVLSLLLGRMFGEHITMMQWIGLVICIVGILLMGKVIK